MKKLSLILLAFFLTGAGSASADGNWGNRSLFYEEEEKYSVEAKSCNLYGEYTLNFAVEDQYNEATSVEITGPGISGSLSLYHNEVLSIWMYWPEGKPSFFGTNPPIPPLTYTFTIVDPSGTTVMTDIIESFVSEHPTNLSPSGGETIIGTPFFSWTGIGPGYEYEVVIVDQQKNYIWDSDDVGENTSAIYDGPALLSGAEYSYYLTAQDEYENESVAKESFVYQPWPGSISGTVSYTGASTGPIYVVAFTDPSFEDDIASVVLNSPGSYTLPGLADGTYYVASAMVTGGLDADLKPTDPWDVYGTWENPTPVTITGGNSESGIDIILVDGTKENPNPFGEEDDEAELYSVEAESHNGSGEQYMVIFYVEDPDHEATSVEITGPGITGSLSLDYFEVGGEWNSMYNDKLLDFGSSPPTPPLTYTFTIVDPSGTTVKTDTVESFFSVYPSNLSPSGGETITGPPFFSWTGIGPGYEYEVVVFDQEMNYIWDSDDQGEETSVRYYGPALTPGAKYFYWVETGDEYNNNSHAEESFVYQEDVGVEEAAHPLFFYLSQNYPNPFNPTTTISYSIPQTDFVQLKVYNVVGEFVRTLVREEKSLGNYTTIWDGRNDKGQLVSSGVYFYTLNTGGNNVISKRMLLHK